VCLSVSRLVAFSSRTDSTCRRGVARLLDVCDVLSQVRAVCRCDVKLTVECAAPAITPTVSSCHVSESALLCVLHLLCTTLSRPSIEAARLSRAQHRVALPRLQGCVMSRHGPLRRHMHTLTGCEVCASAADEANLVMCDVCDRTFHLACLTPKVCHDACVRAC
jgi:hypothetical protein